MEKIPFNKPYLVGKELWYVAQAHGNSMLAGDGPFTKRCHQWLEANNAVDKALLTHSCTAALEIAAMLLNISPGDEVILPSYTFVSTANAFALRGGTPVFVDVRKDTLNLDESLIEAAITPRTKAIVPVHYAGVGCDMGAIMQIAQKYQLAVVEDAAQGLLSTYKGKHLGSIGDLGTFSFHETKNVISGEGGALAINRHDLQERAEIIREKGTDRSRFFRGAVDKYTWQDIGSSFLPGELIAAFLWAQLEEANNITQRRINLWNYYHQAFTQIEADGLARRPIVPAECTHNAHMYYLLLPGLEERSAFIQGMAEKGISCVFHYIPLHCSPYGSKICRTLGPQQNSESLSECLVRLPMWIGLEERQDFVIESAISTLRDTCRSDAPRPW